MKKQSFARRNALLSGGPGRAAAAVLFVAIIAVALRIALPGFFAAATAPFLRGTAAVGNAAGSVTAAFGNPAALSEELDAANAKNESLANENAALAAKVSDLAALLGSRSAATDGVLAGVLSRPPESPYDTLLIDRGAATGIVAGAKVYGPGGVAIGRVASVTNASARVALYSAPGTETPAWVGDARTPVTLTGEGSGAFRASADAGAGIAAGGLVYTAGPGAVPLGAVTRVDTDVSSPEVTLRIRAAANPFSLTWVTVASSAE